MGKKAGVIETDLVHSLRKLKSWYGVDMTETGFVWWHLDVLPHNFKKWWAPISEKLLKHKLRLESVALPDETQANRGTTAAMQHESISHSEDYTSVNWYGTAYTFSKGHQAEAIKALWAEWSKGGHGLSEKTVGEKIGSSSDRYRLAHTFRMKNGKPHPALGTMIRSVGKGVFAICAPDHHKITT